MLVLVCPCVCLSLVIVLNLVSARFVFSGVVLVYHRLSIPPPIPSLRERQTEKETDKMGGKERECVSSWFRLSLVLDGLVVLVLVLSSSWSGLCLGLVLISFSLSDCLSLSLSLSISLHLSLTPSFPQRKTDRDRRQTRWPGDGWCGGSIRPLHRSTSPPSIPPSLRERQTEKETDKMARGGEKVWEYVLDLLFTCAQPTHSLCLLHHTKMPRFLTK